MSQTSDLSSLLSHWRSDPSIGGNITEWKTFSAKGATFGSFPEYIFPVLIDTIIQNGISRPYTHQVSSWQHAHIGDNIVVVTGTASGKTLCYDLPVLDSLFRNSRARSLYIFPTKALAQDQLSSIKELLTVLESQSSHTNTEIPLINPATYDGDTPINQRSKIRKRSRLIYTNPDMLHAGILPHHTRWAEFFAGLEFIIIDEIHAYRGVFGSHVANIIRRLKRVATSYGAHPKFILTSATIGNPAEHAEKLIGSPVKIVDNDGSPHGKKHFIIYNPPVVEPKLGIRVSSSLETVRLVQDLLTYGVQTIVFGRTRRSVEIMLRYLQPPSDPIIDSNSVSRSVRAYRSGYLPRERRDIEQGLREGKVRAVIATPALELGIDIGEMGAAVLSGYPGTISGTWQQAGRAGRSTGVSVAILIATPSPLDQFLAIHPDYFFERIPEHALINPDNPLILLDHLQCAAFEHPVVIGDSFGNVEPDNIADYYKFLINKGVIRLSGNKYFWMSEVYPASNISLRSVSSDRILLKNTSIQPKSIVGTVDIASAIWMVHPNAIYIHEGDTYEVQDLDLANLTASMRPIISDYYTRPKRETDINLIETLNVDKIKNGQKFFGEIKVSTRIVGYQKILWGSQERIGYGELDLPPSELTTHGFWITLDSLLIDWLRDKGLWTSDPNSYGKNWDKQRNLARRRDGFKCQVCGIHEKDRNHHVHHKNPYRTFTSSEEANRLENLITLCAACHRRAENVVKLRSGLSGLAHVLNHLSPLFLMCDTRDIGVHSDPQSPLSDGLPTVVIYENIPAGIGFSQRLFEIHGRLIQSAYNLVYNCTCSDGCPSCVGPGGELGTGSKFETLAILNELRPV